MIKELRKSIQSGNIYKSNVIITEDYNTPNGNITEFRYLNTNLNTGNELNIVFVLPVKESKTFSFGDPLKLIKDNLTNSNSIKDNVIFVQPVFTTVPWFANHPTDLSIQQEKDTINFINFIKNKYSNFPSFKSVLLGFSKSGWGSFSLLMKDSSLADYLFAWDAPLGLSQLTFGLEMEPVFVDDTYFDTYDLSTRLPNEFTSLENKNIYIGGYQLFETESTAFTDLLPSYTGISFNLDESMEFPHQWDIDWMTIFFNEVNFIMQ